MSPLSTTRNVAYRTKTKTWICYELKPKIVRRALNTSYYKRLIGSLTKSLTLLSYFLISLYSTQLSEGTKKTVKI